MCLLGVYACKHSTCLSAPASLAVCYRVTPHSCADHVSHSRVQRGGRFLDGSRQFTPPDPDRSQMTCSDWMKQQGCLLSQTDVNSVCIKGSVVWLCVRSQSQPRSPKADRYIQMISDRKRSEIQTYEMDSDKSKERKMYVHNLQVLSPRKEKRNYTA